MRPERYTVPNGVASAELVIKNSRFIGTVGPAHDAEAARGFVTETARHYYDASHNAWAFRIATGPQGEVGFSDDGEPGGTAGRPMLAILDGSGLSQVVAVGTRYFGGTKLGTGGLVRAYSACVREALAGLCTIDMVLHHLARIEIDYGAYGPLSYQLPQLGVKIEDVAYADRVSLTLAAPSKSRAATASLLQELTNGQIMLAELTEWSATRYDPAS
ncbi:MAG: DUF1949 domain-containing protein [Chloroflexi bacterium]|nr:DUF1949 domain-containing protein [Chloroflexota bacterium]